MSSYPFGGHLFWGPLYTLFILGDSDTDVDHTPFSTHNVLSCIIIVVGDALSGGELSGVEWLVQGAILLGHRNARLWRVLHK